MTGTENVAKAAENTVQRWFHISNRLRLMVKTSLSRGVDDKPDPQTEYGRTKRMGEVSRKHKKSNYQIIRTA